jgi:hypothetical protein
LKETSESYAEENACAEKQGDLVGLSENELCVVIEEHVLENHGVVEPGARERVVHGDVDIVVGERELGEGKY